MKLRVGEKEYSFQNESNFMYLPGVALILLGLIIYFIPKLLLFLISAGFIFLGGLFITIVYRFKKFKKSSIRFVDDRCSLEDD
jgi:hypothetical protein